MHMSEYVGIRHIAAHIHRFVRKNPEPFIYYWISADKLKTASIPEILRNNIMVAKYQALVSVKPAGKLCIPADTFIS